MKDVNPETIIDTQSWYKILPTQWMARETYPPGRVNNRRRRTREGPELACVQTRVNIFFRRRRVYESFFWSRSPSRKSFTHAIPWSLAELVKSCPGVIVHQRLTVPRQMVLLKERYAESRKELLHYCCNLVVGGFHGMLLLSAKCSRLLVRREITL